MTVQASAPDELEHQDDHGHAHGREYVIVVNGQAKTVMGDRVTYEQVVALAYPVLPAPDTIFSVTYRRAKEPHEGSLVEGQSVEVRKEGTVFNVTPTGKS